MGWKIIQAVIFLTVFFWMIWFGQQPGNVSAQNQFVPFIVALLATLFVSAIPIMLADFRRVLARMLGRDGQQGGTGQDRIGGGA